MPRSAFFRRTLIACAAACLALPPAMAAELGEMTVQSHVGQPLLAEVELTALAPEEANGVAVRLASPDVYRGGGIGMDAALQGLTITPVERGGRRYVRVATQQAIQAGHVHLYLLLGNGNAAIVRLATLWLTPPPPTPPTPPTPPAPPVVTAPIKPLSAPQSPAASVPPDAAALAARARAEGMLRPPAVFVAPPAQPKAAAAAIRPPMVVRPPPLHRRAAPVAACAPQADAEACVALEQKNTALNDTLGELEGKNGALQKALAQPATATAALPAAAPAGAQPPIRLASTRGALFICISVIRLGEEGGGPSETDACQIPQPLHIDGIEAAQIGGVLGRERTANLSPDMYVAVLDRAALRYS